MSGHPRAVSAITSTSDRLMKLHDEIADLKATFDADKELSEENLNYITFVGLARDINSHDQKSLKRSTHLL